MAASLLLLWVVTRATVAFGHMDFSYLFTSLLYTITSIFLMHKFSYSLQSISISLCLVTVSISGVLASWGSLTLDGAGIVYEAFGYIAMFLIIRPKSNGSLRNNHLKFLGAIGG